jgi:hypothetical protein
MIYSMKKKVVVVVVVMRRVSLNKNQHGKDKYLFKTGPLNGTNKCYYFKLVTY